MPNLRRSRTRARRRATLVVPPSDFSLRTNHDEVAAYFQWLRWLIYEIDKYTTKRFVVDFSNIKTISPGAGIMLAAELDRWQQTIQRRLRAHKPETWAPATQNFMREMGLFDLLSVGDPTSTTGSAPEDVTYIKYIRGVRTNGEMCAALLDMLSNVAERPAVEHFIYDGLVEALKNVGHHAYVDDQWCGVQKGTWWICAAFDRPDGTVTACVYDPGVGIPKTLPRSGLWERVQAVLKAFGKSDDADMIAAAMEAGRTRTALDERGKGLPIMMRLIDHCPGHLRVVSGSGEAIYTGNGTVQKIQHQFSIGGTLIEWTVRQPSVKDDHND